MGYIHVAAISDDPEPVLAALRELGAEKMILVGDDDAHAAELSHRLEPLGVATERRTVDGDMLTGTMRLMQRIVHEHPDREADILVNLGAASRYQACAFLSAAFVTGLRTIDREDGQIRFLPVLRFSYEEIIGEEELAILRAFDELDGHEGTLLELSRHVDLPSSRISYAVRGGEDADGLEPLGLVEVDAAGDGDVVLRLTPMGENLSRGIHR